MNEMTLQNLFFINSLQAFLNEYPAQVGLLCLQIMWTTMSSLHRIWVKWTVSSTKLLLPFKFITKMSLKNCISLMSNHLVTLSGWSCVDFIGEKSMTVVLSLLQTLISSTIVSILEDDQLDLQELVRLSLWKISKLKISVKDLGRIFKGLAQSGCWAMCSKAEGKYDQM